MAPTLHDISAATTSELPRGDRLPMPHEVYGIRRRVRAHTRITFAESPELYLREEMC
jgi:hypothetical protein